MNSRMAIIDAETMTLQGDGARVPRAARGAPVAG